jgi:predicted dehydrogenase
MRLAIVGCGFVADFYRQTLPLHPELTLAGVMDRDPSRATRFSRLCRVPCYGSMDELLSDNSVDIVVNLTNPDSHFAVSKASLEAGKHVYSEKPLAMTLSEARALVDLAEQRGLGLSSAPCSLLGETAQTIWKALRENAIGQVRLVYAEMDDGMVHRMPYRKWHSASGVPWPAKDEFEVGCTLEHAGYYLTWLPAFFGPAKVVSAFSSCQIPDKQTDTPLDRIAPDFSVACIKFASGVVARLTCGIIAPHDHSLRIIGDEGVLSIKDCWDYHSPVYIRRRWNIRRSTILSPWASKYPLARAPYPPLKRGGAARMDFCRGIAELAEAIHMQRPSRLSARYCLHVNEIVLAIHGAGDAGSSWTVSTGFDPVPPMPWTRDQRLG